MNLAEKGDRFHRYATLKLFETPLKEKENKKKQGQAKVSSLNAS